MTLAERRTIDALSADLATGKTTSRALIEEALDAIGRDGSAFTLVAAERARAEADHWDRLRKMDVRPSILAGLPISVKDLFEIAGETTTAGAAILRGNPTEINSAPVIDRLRAAGAIIVGRTHMSEFAFHGIGTNPHYPRCANPHDAARVPGGSSSGAAVSVTRGQVVMGLGTDTGGSTRVPAAFCGVVGYKPTQRRITREGAFPLSETLDSIGPIANSVLCCAHVDRLIADAPTPWHPSLGLKGLRLGVPTTLVLDDMDETVARSFERALGALSKAGAQVERLAADAFARMPKIYANGSIANAESYAFHSNAGLLRQGAGYDQNVYNRIMIGARMTAKDYIDILHARAEIIRDADRVSAPFDALVMPTAPIVAPRFEDVVDPAAFTRTNSLALRNAMLVNLIDRCALSIPMQRQGELPTGLMVVGETMGDARLFSIGRAVEEALREVVAS